MGKGADTFGPPKPAQSVPESPQMQRAAAQANAQGVTADLQKQGITHDPNAAQQPSGAPTGGAKPSEPMPPPGSAYTKPNQGMSR